VSNSLPAADGPDSRLVRLLCLALAAAALLLAWLPGLTPRLLVAGDFALDGPVRLVHWLVGGTAAAAALVTAASRPGRSALLSLALTVTAAGAWLAAASSIDLGVMAVLWGAGWILAAAGLSRASNPLRIEAAIKMLGLGGAAAMILVLGAALVAGLTGTTHLLEAGYLLTSLPDSTILALAATRILLVACALAAAWVPFHLWAPDGLSAAPRPVAAVLAVAAPLAAVITLSRVLYSLEPSLNALSVHWQGGLFAIAILTVVVAGSVALVQRDAARLLAYITIVQCAELLPAVVMAPRDAGVLAVAASGHVLALVPAWLALAAWNEADGGATSFERLAGEGARAPLRAVLLASAVALAVGIPGGVRFLSRPETALWATPQAGWGTVLVVSTVLQWAAVVRLFRVIFLEARPEPEGRTQEGRMSPAWVVVALLLAAQVSVVLAGWPPGLDGAWRVLLPGG
jgi:NADH-quinone oxidoreductase subunit N